MASILTYNEKKEELELIKKTIYELAAYLDDNDWEIEMFNELSKFSRSAVRDVLWDMLCCDVTPAGAAEELETLRSKDNSAKLMIIADPTTSPLLYIRPNILASTLILRPLSRDELKSRITEMYRQLCFSDKEQNEEAFSFKGRDGVVRVLYKDILYFEAKDKKLYLCTEKAEYAFYDTLENLILSLPEQFIRCHKSFIVNSQYVTRVAISQGQIFLGDVELPLSRSYKQVIKEAIL